MKFSSKIFQLALFGLLSVCGSCAPCSYMSRVVDLLWKQLEPGAPTLLSAVLGRMTKGGTEALSPPLLPINFSFVILVFCISFDQIEIGELRRKGLPTFIQSVILNFGLFVPPFEGEGQTFVFSPRFFVAIMNASFRFDHISADGPPPQRLQSVRLDIHLSTCFYFLFLTKHIFNCPASKELRKHFYFLESETL